MILMCTLHTDVRRSSSIYVSSTYYVRKCTKAIYIFSISTDAQQAIAETDWSSGTREAQERIKPIGGECLQEMDISAERRFISMGMF